jgi:hypothetical protein
MGGDEEQVSTVKRRTNGPCKDAIEEAKEPLFMGSKPLEAHWKSVFLDIDAQLHCLEEDVPAIQKREDVRATYD